MLISTNSNITKQHKTISPCINNWSVLVEQANIDSFSNSSSWIILNNSLEQSIIKKVNKNGTKLSNWNINIYYGIKTGLNDAFIIDEITKNQLIFDDPKSAELIRPLLRGRDIKRYGFDNSNLYMIIPHNGIRSLGIDRVNIDDYPAIKSHLDKYYDRLVKRYDKGDTPYNLRSCDYMDEFNKQKLVWTPVNSEYRFAIIPKGYVFNNSLFMMTGDKIELICAVLNSDLYRFYLYTMFSNGNYTYGSSAFFSKLPVIKETTLFDKIKQLVDTINDNFTDKIIELNNIIYGLYDISPEEIDFITKKLASL